MAELKKDQSQLEQEGIEEQKKNEQGGELNSDSKKQTQNDDQTAQEIVKLDEIVEEKEYSEEEFDELRKLYEDTVNEFVEGELIVGKILSINDKEVTVDIGFKSEGSIPLDEFTNPQDLNVGDDIEVFLENIEDMDGQLVLSRKKVDFIHSWENVINSYESGEILQGRCIRRIKGGIVVDLNGIDAFLPGSQIDVKPIRDFDAFIGQMMDFKVVKVNQLRKNIVVSHRVLVEEEMKEQRGKILENLEKGQILEGTVKNITDFGVFIDLGGVDGLLHINDLSWGRISHPSEIVALDETIKVMVLDFNEEKDRISLGLKQMQPHPWENVTEKYPVGTVVKGKVVNISDYGAFIEIEKGVEGLIHISEMSWTQHIKHPSKVLAVGEIVETKILSIDQDEKKISLGLKQLEPDPWDTLEEKYPIGSKHEGIVRNLTNFGAFIELEEGIDGLIHISDLSWTKKIRHPGEVLKKGDSIEVVVLNVDRENRRISLGFKQTMANPWDEFQEKYKPGTTTKGQIVRLIEKGVIAELPDGVDGFVPISHLTKPNVKKPSDGYKVGDEIELCVLEFNKEAKKIVLSENIEYATNLVSEKDGQEKVTSAEEEVELIFDKEEKDSSEKAADSETKEVEKEKKPETTVEKEVDEKAEKSEEQAEEQTEEQTEDASKEVSEKEEKKTTTEKNEAEKAEKSEEEKSPTEVKESEEPPKEEDEKKEEKVVMQAETDKEVADKKEAEKAEKPKKSKSKKSDSKKEEADLKAEKKEDNQDKEKDTKKKSKKKSAQEADDTSSEEKKKKKKSTEKKTAKKEKEEKPEEDSKENDENSEKK